MTPDKTTGSLEFLAVEEDLHRRLRRSLVAILLMLAASTAALTHLASLLEARAGDARGYARHR